jgi:hypothetical protein
LERVSAWPFYNPQGLCIDSSDFIHARLPCFVAK